MMSSTRRVDATDIEDDDQFDDNIQKDAYHLASSNSSHLILTQVQLKEDNYDE